MKFTLTVSNLQQMAGKVMVYRNEHFNCNKSECKKLAMYIRIEGKWTRIGNYGLECKQFESLDLQQEEKDRLDREKCNSIKLQLRQFKAESRARRKTIENELNMTTSFFKQQIK
jgi:hypothetical protein